MDRVLVVAEEASTSDRAAGVFSGLGVEVTQIKRPAEARGAGSAKTYSLILLCLEREDSGALEEALPRLMEAYPDAPVALAVPDPSLAFTLHAFRLGTFDLVIQPLTADAVRTVLSRSRTWRQARIVRKLQDLTQLCGWFAHEVRNPLSGILTSAQVLAEGSALPERSREYLKIIVEESLRLERFLHRLAEIGRSPRRHVVPAPLNAVVERALTPLRPQMRRHGIGLAWQPGDRLPEVSIDTGQVEHAISLVIMNALDATPRGGALSLLTRHRPEERVVELEVTSTGDGVRPVDERLFLDPFLARKSPGRDLGLTHALLTFAQHGGGVTFGSQPSLSRTFLLQLPLTRQGARSPVKLTADS